MFQSMATEHPTSISDWLKFCFMSSERLRCCHLNRFILSMRSFLQGYVGLTLLLEAKDKLKYGTAIECARLTLMMWKGLKSTCR